MLMPLQGTAPMQTGAGGGNRNVLNKPYNGNREREWSHGLCSCFGDIGTCCLATWLPCMAYSSNKSRLDYLERNGTPHPTHGEICSGDCVIHGLITLCGCGWVLQIGVRNNVRNRYAIEGGACGDCMSAFCCAPCELTQESREIQLEEHSFRR
ncbi:PLAC8-domain-containing protein [Dentipellis sp. KUC8613]|nr:PLAC8-domain-containing protein [Dentipellis sp. KUC8613]